MGSHNVACHPAEVTFPPFPQPKLVLDLATPKGCKAELSYIWSRKSAHKYAIFDANISLSTYVPKNPFVANALN